MSSTIRPRKKPVNEAAFVEAAEKSTTTSSEANLDATERVSARAAGRKYAIYTLRGTEAQHELLKYAAKQKGMSQNELIAHYVLTPLEDEFGSEVPF